MSRDDAIAAFLAHHGFAHARAEPLAQDASFRRYLRLRGGPRPAVLMDAPPPEDVRPFLRIAAHLAAVGLSAPEIIGADPESGLVLEEDLGDGLFPALLSPETIGPLMDAAVATLVALQRAPVRDGLVSCPDRSLPFTANDADQRAPENKKLVCRPEAPRRKTSVRVGTLAAWDAPAMTAATLDPLLDWWWPATFGHSAPAAARAEIAAALTAMLASATAGPSGFVHRDFFAGNLLWLPDRAGMRRVGIIDFQGAAIGHPAYDLVSLIQDARRDIPAAVAQRALDQYLDYRPELDPAAFRAAFAACAAQRHLRVATQWVRLAQRDGRPQYLIHGPRTWRLLDEALLHPVAAPLAAALDRWIPRPLRRNPPDLAA